MSQFKNEPAVRNSNNEGMVKRYVHQPLTIDHFGIHAKIQVNGKVLITKIAAQSPDTDDVEYDEIEIPASLIFDLAKALKMTRTIEFVPVSEVGAKPFVSEKKTE